MLSPSLCEFNGASPSPFHEPCVRTKKIYLCGFVQKRLHNQTLYAISNDLMSLFFVTCNPTETQVKPIRFSILDYMDVLQSSDVGLFYVNEFTLKDQRCLVILRAMTELGVPLIFMKNPRLKVSVIKPNSDIHRDETRYLQHAVYIGCKDAVVFDPLQHRYSMKQLKIRIYDSVYHKLQTPRSDVVHGIEETFVLPPIHSSSSLTVRIDLWSPPRRRIRSLSTGQALKNKHNKDFLLRQPIKAIQRNASDHGSYSNSTKSSEEMCTGSDDISSPLGPSKSMPFLMFPDEPLRVESGIDHPRDVENGSIWGSDSSLEEDAKAAPVIIGPEGPVGLPDYEDLAPFEDDL